MPPHINEIQKRRSGIQYVFLFLALLSLGILFLWMPSFLNEPPRTFPTRTLIVVDEGLTQDAVTKLLKEEGVIRSSLYLYLLLRTEYGDGYVQAGTYQFETPKTTAEIAHALVTGEGSAPLLRFTLPEGFHARVKVFAPRGLRLCRRNQR